MIIFRSALATRVFLIAVLGVAALLASAHASAGSLDHSPRWREQRTQSQSRTVTVPPAPQTPMFQPAPKPPIPLNVPVLVGPLNPDPMPHCDPNNPTTPVAAPTPSAIAGGLALLGVIGARRRRVAE